MKGKKRSFIVLLALVLSITSTLTACTGDKDDQNLKTYFTDAVVTDSGFSAELTLSDAEFVTSDQSAFVLSTTVVGAETEEITEVSLDSFAISKTDSASTLKIDFTDENASEHGGSWILTSNKVVTSAGEYVAFVISAGESSFSFSCSASDFSTLAETVVVDCELYGATLKESFSAADLVLEGVLAGKQFSLIKQSSNAFSLDFGNVFHDSDEDGYGYITLKASAVNTLYPADSTVGITLENIPVETIFAEIAVEGNTAVVPLRTSYGLFEGIGKEDITLVHSDFDNTPVEAVTVENVVFENNKLTVTFVGEDIAAKLNKAVIRFNENNALQEELLIGIGELSSFLTSSTDILKNEGALSGYRVECTVNNGYFDGLTNSDIAVSAGGAEYDVNSIDRDSFVIEFATSQETLDVSITIPAAKVINHFGISEDVVLELKCVGTEPDRGEILTSIGMGIAKGLGGKIGEVVGGKIYEKVLEPILISLGIASEDPLDTIQESLTTLQDSVNSLGYRMEQLSQQITAAVADIKNYIDLAQYQTTLLGYNSSFNKINLFNLQNYGDEDGLAKVMLFREQYRNESGVVEVPADKQEEYHAAMEKFVTYVSTTGDWTNIIADIKTFGENLVAASAGTNGGYLEAYWKCMESFYPFSTLTIEPKSTFLDGAMGNYTLAMNAALIYCDYSGSTAVAQTLIESYNNVYNKVLAYDQNIADIKTDLQSGKIFDYIQGTYLSTQISQYGAHTEGEQLLQSSFDFYGHSITDIETVINQCHNMGMDLITAMKKAGFIGLQAGSGGNYRILINSSVSREQKSTPYKLSFFNTCSIDEYTYYEAKILTYNPTNKTYSISVEKIFNEHISYVMGLSGNRLNYRMYRLHNAHDAFNMFSH